ncbi:uncharacterized protein J7T54_007503 [Emericellopsis cladophorae]|uniref:Wbp11/ELF5/Saf1 N-terminal domain-containing protein n=1 Tax=Emericellopsis cladophorae TaxID=2686198 RepID=A0A9P9XY80_9HYPO|nr:uncharacterized protein J7T54_007503 [Emericellopsis cladophorae]KAI6780027.1 hypothetical protein J7T54_007503 [Emericellopsis cladophorae]
MAKERNYNPVQAQRKADKAKAIKKGKAESLVRKNEKLAKKNPERIQKQIDDLKAITTNGGKLSKHEEQVLDGLENELRSVRKARDTLGDRAPTFGRGWTRDHDGPAVLGKRRRGSNASTSEEDVPEDVRSIPMPRDTPPPIPKDVLDAWYAKRRARREAENAAAHNKDNEPKKDAPPAEAKVTYSAEPVRRDLRKEAVAAFVPNVVKLKMDKGQGQGGLMEPDEADRLEQEGYLKPQPPPSKAVTVEEADDED